MELRLRLGTLGPGMIKEVPPHKLCLHFPTFPDTFHDISHQSVGTSVHPSIFWPQILFFPHPRYLKVSFLPGYFPRARPVTMSNIGLKWRAMPEIWGFIFPKYVNWQKLGSISLFWEENKKICWFSGLKGKILGDQKLFSSQLSKTAVSFPPPTPWIWPEYWRMHR